MKYQIGSFTNIRSLILKNSILNAILTNELIEQNLPVYVGSSLIQLSDDEKEFNIRQTGKSPNYAMAKVYAYRGMGFKGRYFKVGYSIHESTIVWQTNIHKKIGNYIAYLKELSDKIYKLYSICAVKSDNVFSNVPASFVNYAEASGMSINYWKQGFSKKIKNVLQEIDQDEIKKYHALLVSRLNDWRLFNYLLTLLVKSNTFELEKENVGKITASKIIPKNTVRLTFYSYVDYSQRTIDVPFQKLNPVEWERESYDINIFDLRAIIF